MKLIVPISKNKMDVIISLLAFFGLMAFLISGSIILIVMTPYPFNLSGIMLIFMAVWALDIFFCLCIFSRIKKLNPFQFKDDN